MKYLAIRGGLFGALLFSATTLSTVRVEAQPPSTANPSPSKTTVGRVMDKAEQVVPLGIGAKAPEVEVSSMDGKKVLLKDVYAQGPTVLIFFRGGWCPFCNMHLSSLQKIKDELTSEGLRIVAISPDLPEFTKKEVEDKKLGYLLLSDAPANSIKAFGLAFRLDDTTNSIYMGMGIDLDLRSGQTHHILPVPAAYIIDKEGVIQFAHWDSDYKKRIDNESLLKAAHETVAKERNKK